MAKVVIFLHLCRFLKMTSGSRGVVFNFARRSGMLDIGYGRRNGMTVAVSLIWMSYSCFLGRVSLVGGFR